MLYCVVTEKLFQEVSNEVLQIVGDVEDFANPLTQAASLVLQFIAEHAIALT